MASPLGTAFSRVDALKRQLYDMITNPRDAAAMLGGRIVESGQQAQALQEQAFGDPNRPFRVTDPQAMARLTDMLMAGPMGFAPAGITAYHGSPHLFRQFDPSRVGTGEGQQAYGVGAGYTAQAREVAEEYKNLVQADKGGGFPSFWARLKYAELGGDKEKAAASINENISWLKNNRDLVSKSMNVDEAIQNYQNALKVLKDIQPNQGYLYKGDIPDEILPKFLDWDKPFSKQPKDVQNAYKQIATEFKEAGDPRAVLMEGNIKNDGTGSMMYQSFVHRDDIQNELKQQASKMLESKGVRGIRYLDQGSRAEGKGTSNFVPFRAEDFKVEEINDLPLQEWINKGLL